MPQKVVFVNSLILEALNGELAPSVIKKRADQGNLKDYLESL